jgi:hypothetical protein
LKGTPALRACAPPTCVGPPCRLRRLSGGAVIQRTPRR